MLKICTGNVHVSRGLLALMLFGAPGLGMADTRMTFQPPVTEIASRVSDLHSFLMGIIIVIFVAVFGMMFWAIFRHRKNLGHQAKPFHESTTVEIIWTIIPALILIAMAWPAAKLVISQRNSAQPDITIKVTGYQWYWGYDYLDQSFGFKSKLLTPQDQIQNYGPNAPAKDAHYLLEVDEPLVVPVDKKVRLLVTSNDVIHSWGMPAFAVKQDAIPGFIRDTWFKANKIGIYRGQCVELCGRSHGFMPTVVKVVSQKDFDTWVAAKQLAAKATLFEPGKPITKEALIEAGAKVYANNCAACHQPDGKGAGPFPALAGSKIATGPKAGHIHIVLNGKNAMPSWKAALSDAELAAVITYERNSFGNHTGDFVMPDEVKAAR
ncbi:cytochrome c oxidase subunit II [Leeia oryzae]|uniref:cytochrome c oxidase subunit II n=1 Tax=Leeia oryzae TaxID=356662 RepID=UPI00036DF68A|nr:cytochrome c oxidase subunit II [Leeia oryzae]